MTADAAGRPPRVTLVHDYLTQRGGAERVVLHMLDAFPGAPLHTALYDPHGTFHEFAAADVRPSVLNRSAALRRDHRRALPLLAPVFSRLRVAEADVVLASSSGWAHGVHTDAPLVVYCHNPARWLYQPEQYLAGRGSGARTALAVGRGPLRRWDRRAARRATRYLCQSTTVQRRIADTYGIEADTLPPPPGLTPDGPQRPPEGAPGPGFVLCIARLMPYKHVDAVVAAFEALPAERLVVVGDGPDRAAVAAAAGPNVHLAGSVDDDVLRWYLANCAGVVSAAHEDFGLTPLEALGFGRPSAVLRWGGFVDTVVDGTTGVFFDTPEPAAVATAVRTMLAASWDREALAAHLDRFSAARFVSRLRAIVDEVAG